MLCNPEETHTHHARRPHIVDGAENAFGNLLIVLVVAHIVSHSLYESLLQLGNITAVVMFCNEVRTGLDLGCKLH